MAEQPVSAAEQAANAERALAEGRKFDAEARLADMTARTETATARKTEAEARASEAHALQSELKVKEAEEDDAARRASDEYNHVYRFDGEVSPSSVSKCMSKLTEWHRLDPNGEIEVIFSSPGGAIFDGLELFDFIVELGEKGHRVTTGGAGMAASMAGILVQAGTHRFLTKECWLLIHRAAFGAVGQTFEVEDRVELIKRIEKRIIDIFVSRSGGKITAAKIKRNWERKDFWLSSDECLEFGLIDEVRGHIPV